MIDIDNAQGLKLCAVDLPQQIKHSRTRAILPLEVPAFHWSLSPCDLLYVRPTMFDVTKTCGVYVWISPIPGTPGFRLSNTPLPGFRELQFGWECLPNVGRVVELISVLPSPETYVHVSDAAHYVSLTHKNSSVKVTSKHRSTHRGNLSPM